MLTRLLALLLLPLSLLPQLRAEVSLPRVFGDHMVLQRDLPVPVWGRAAPGERVTVRFAGQEKRADANASGDWRVPLDPLPASAEPRTLVVSGANTVTLQDVLVGEVWLCSGQSNMEFGVKNDADAAALVAAADKPDLRLFLVSKKSSATPAPDVRASWAVCTPESVIQGGWGGFSSVAYRFAGQLQARLKVPVGLIESSWGGTRIEPWTPPESYARLPAFAKEAASTPLKIDGVSPGQIFNGMIRPLAPFALRGILWYQGESNVAACNDGLRYADKLEALIDGWRQLWARPDLPFFSVQLAPYLYSRRKKDKIHHDAFDLPKLWEAQSLALAIPFTGLVPNTDTTDHLTNIHPRSKAAVASRLAALALARLYGHPEIVHAGPVFDRLELDGARAIVHFRTADGLRNRDNAPLSDFEIAGADSAYVPAQATITGADTVVVSSPKVPAPKSVRFAWRETARPNLANDSGWPAYPFRSDAPAWSPRPER